MTSEFLTNLFSTNGLILIVKLTVLVIEFLYIIFALILIREVHLMNSSFKTRVGGLFSIVTYVHLAAAVVAFLISLTLLNS